MASGLPIELEQEYNRNKKLDKFFNDNDNIVSAYLPLKFRATTFKSHLTDFEKAIPGKDITTTGITKSKNDLKDEVAAVYGPICLTVRSFALRYDLEDLAANMNFPEYKIAHMADGEILPFAQATNQFIETMALPDANFTEYEITAPILVAALGIAIDFNNTIGVVGSVTGTVSAVIKELTDRNKVLRADVNDFNLIMSRYKKENINFFNGFEAVRKIDNIGVHHSGVEGTVTKSGEIQKNVKVVCAQYPKKTDKTDILGHYEIDEIRPGSYEFIFTLENGDSRTVIIKIEKGKMKTVDVNF